MNRAVIETILRYVISPLVAFAAGKGWVDPAGQGDLIAALIALGVALHGVAATVTNKRAAEKAETEKKAAQEAANRAIENSGR